MVCAQSVDSPDRTIGTVGCAEANFVPLQTPGSPGKQTTSDAIMHTAHRGLERRQGMSRPASETVARELRRMIITGELAPGGLVSEVQLSKVLGCSRTPLREALQQLSQQYLLTLPPRRGVLIQPLSILDCQEIHDVMYDIGSACIVRVSSRIGPKELERLRSIVSRQEEANNEADCYQLTELDVEFHTAIAQFTGNRYLVYSTERIQSALARFLYPAYKAAGGARVSIAEHKAILEALAKGDSEMANLRLREHVSNGRERVLDILGRGDDRQDAALGEA
jgi:DNA-binding GntR family transcriptional regulator